MSFTISVHSNAASLFYSLWLSLILNAMAEPTVPKEDCDHVELGETHEKGAEAPPFLPDPEAERRLVRKLDRKVLPWIMLLYLLSYLDRCVLSFLALSPSHRSLIV